MTGIPVFCGNSPYNRKRPCKADLLYGRPLPVDSDKDLRSQSDLKREAKAGLVLSAAGVISMERHTWKLGGNALCRTACTAVGEGRENLPCSLVSRRKTEESSLPSTGAGGCGAAGFEKPGFLQGNGSQQSRRGCPFAERGSRAACQPLPGGSKTCKQGGGRGKNTENLQLAMGGRVFPPVSTETIKECSA